MKAHLQIRNIIATAEPEAVVQLAEQETAQPPLQTQMPTTPTTATKTPTIRTRPKIPKMSRMPTVKCTNRRLRHGISKSIKINTNPTIHIRPAPVIMTTHTAATRPVLAMVTPMELVDRQVTEEVPPGTMDRITSIRRSMAKPVEDIIKLPTISTPAATVEASTATSNTAAQVAAKSATKQATRRCTSQDPTPPVVNNNKTNTIQEGIIISIKRND